MGKKLQQPRTKGNVKPSTSEQAAQFLASKNLGSIQGFAGLAGGLGFVRADDLDPEMDADIRQLFRRLDKKDALTKQKALQDLSTVVSEKEESALNGALPYWPRLFSRLTTDDDRKVRSSTHKVMEVLGCRCGKHLAPYLKSLLPAWVMARGDDYEPAALAALAAFEAVFPPAKRNDALRHAWSGVFDLAEEALTAEPPPNGDSEETQAVSARHNRSVSAALRGLALVYPLVREKDAASDRLLQLMRGRRFWRHYEGHASTGGAAAASPETGAASGLIRSAYCDLVVCLCREHPEFVRQPACAGAICEVVLRDISVANPLVAGALWDAVLSVIQTLGEQVWQHVSLKKAFLPKLNALLISGGAGCARKIYPCLLPLFSQLSLAANPENRRLGQALLGRILEGLRQDRVAVSRSEARAVAKAYLECCRYLIAEVRHSAPEEVAELVATGACDFYFGCLSDACFYRHVLDLAAEQFVLLLAFLHRHLVEKEFPTAVAALCDFLKDKNVLESPHGLLGVAALIEELAGSGTEKAKKGKRQVGFDRGSPVPANSLKMAPWAGPVLLEVVSALLGGVAWHRDNPNAWPAVLAALWRLGDVSTLRSRFPEPFETLVEGFPKLLTHFEVTRDLLNSPGLLHASISGYCVLLSGTNMAPSDASALLQRHFEAMDEPLRLAFLSRGLQPLLGGLPEAMASAVSATLETKISAWSRALLASVFVRLDASAETAFRGVLDMLLHHVPAKMLSLWALRGELMAHVDGCLAELGPEVCLSREKCGHLVAMLSHLLDTCVVEAEAGAMESILSRLNGYFLALLSFAEREEDGVKTAKEALLHHVRARLGLGANGPFVASLVSTTVEGVCAAGSDPIALVLCNEYAVDVCHQILLSELELQEAESPLHDSLLSLLLDKATALYLSIEASIAKNGLFQLVVTSHQHASFVCLARCVFLLTALLKVAPSLLASLTSRTEGPAVLSRLVHCCLFLQAKFEALGVSGSSVVEGIAAFESDILEQPLLLANDLQDSILRQLMLGDLLCRQGDKMSPKRRAELLDADAMRLEWLDEEAAEERLAIFLTKDLPYLMQSGPQVRERMLTALTERLAADQTPSPAELSRHLRLLGAIATLEPGLCGSCLEAFSSLHERHYSLFFPDDDEGSEKTAPGGQHLQAAVATMSLLRQCVQHNAAELSEKDWDVILCNSAAWLSYQLPSHGDSLDAKALDGQVFGYHLLRLLAQLGATLTDNEGLPERIIEEWRNFYVGLIYNAALAQFMTRDDVMPAASQSPSPPHWIVLCDAVAKIPAEHLLAFSIDTKLAIDEASQIEDKRVLTLVNSLAPALVSADTRFCDRLAICCMLTTLAKDGHFSVDPGLAENVDEPSFELPHGLWAALAACGQVVERLQELAAFGGGAGGLDCLVDHSVEEEDEEDCGRSSDLSLLCGYLLTWRIVMALFEASAPAVKAHHAERLLHSGLFDQLQQCLFRVLPLNPTLKLHSQLRRHKSGAKLTSALSMFETELQMGMDPVLPHLRRSWLLHLAVSVCLQVLRVAPALARHWWLSLRKKESAIVERYTERLISPILIQREMEVVNAMAPTVFPDQDVVQVKGKPAVREIQAIYRVTEEHRTELLISLPENYPLGAISVQTFKKIGISAQQWRALQLQMTTFLKNQNGTVLEGLSLWKRNIDTKMEGVEDCMICFSIIHGTNYQLPRMTCRTCKKKFHVHCLYKWFQTSQNHTCPLCRNIFQLSNVRYGQSR